MIQAENGAVKSGFVIHFNRLAGIASFFPPRGRIYIVGWE